MKENGFMSFIERNLMTRSYMKKFAAINVAIFIAEYAYITKILVPRQMEIGKNGSMDFH